MLPGPVEAGYRTTEVADPIGGAGCRSRVPDASMMALTPVEAVHSPWAGLSPLVTFTLFTGDPKII
jgi:hypothetical protein